MSVRTGSVLLVLALASGCDLPGRPQRDKRPVSPDQIVDFATLYRQNCAGCHGANGNLGPAPPLNDPIFLKIVPDTTLLTVIAEGRPGTPMPAFARGRGGPLTDAQVKVLAEGIKPRWDIPWESGESALPSYIMAAGGTNGEKERGAGAFRRACAGCHGPQGKGAVAGAINNRSFLALISNQALRRYAITGRPDLGMPDYATPKERGNDFQPLSAAEIDDLVALLADWRKPEPGASP